MSQAQNAILDVLTMTNCNSISVNFRQNIHEALCHPEIIHMAPFVCIKSLSYSVEDIFIKLSIKVEFEFMKSPDS